MLGLNIENQKLICGVIWTWEETIPDYPASDYELKILLKKPNVNVITLTATASGDTHVFTITASTTSGYSNNSGTYLYQAIATSRSVATEIYEAAAPGIIEILPDLSTKPDPRSFALKMVDAIQTALYALAQKTMSSVSIEGHTYTYKDEDKLIERLNYWERKSGTKKRQRVLYQFDNN